MFHGTVVMFYSYHCTRDPLVLNNYDHCTCYYDSNLIACGLFHLDSLLVIRRNIYFARTNFYDFPFL